MITPSPHTVGDEVAAGSSGAVNRAMVAGVGGKLGVTVLNLAIVALAARALGAAGFGIVALLTGLVTTLGFLDLGVGNSVISVISAKLSTSQHSKAREDVAVALLATTAIGLTVAVVGSCMAFAIPTNLVFSTPGISSVDVRLSFAMFAMSLGLAIPGAMGSRICLAQQRGATNNLYLVAGAVLSCAATALAAVLHGPVWTFIAATVMVPNLVLGFQTWIFTYRSEYSVRPLWAGASMGRVRTMASNSFWFMVLGACSALSSQTGTLVAAYVLDSRAAGVVGLTTRAFSLVTSVFFGGLQQSWASTARAMAHGRADWVRANFWRILRVTLLPVVVCSTLLVIVGRPVITIWAGSGLAPHLDLLLIMAVWTCYAFVMTQLSFLLNAAEIVRPQALLSIALVAATIPLSVVLTDRWGLIGSTCAMLIAHLCVMGFPLVAMTRNILRRVDRSRATHTEGLTE